MIRALVLALLAGLGAPAFALSCLPHDIARSYDEAARAEEAYIVVHGVLEFDASALPKVDMSRQHEVPPDTLIPARMTGKALSHDGFVMDFDRAITLNAQCFGPWCAGAVPGTEYLAFLERRADGYRLTINPCGGFGFPEPSPETLERVQECFDGGPCDPAPLR